MALSINIPELSVVSDGNTDKVEFARRSEKAAELVHDFVQQSSLSAFDAMLGAAEDSALEAAKEAAATAEETAEQTMMVQKEVARFLAQAPKG
ncbi:hypothetical protein [Pelagibius sp. Alg239-R121]|uniref:hypothetical protein n=1 Tax=Pelagibius sp. Alg239-R121 TaxID=2993448 RepID=UPI0024A71B99|nr:hypothetical protein [Pelagibius sp. Alg239-R121]